MMGGLGLSALRKQSIMIGGTSSMTVTGRSTPDQNMFANNSQIMETTLSAGGSTMIDGRQVGF